MTAQTEKPQTPDPVDGRILAALLEAGEAFVSGTRLAETLGISRPAVWGRLEKLRAAGFEFEAVRKRGYRLLRVPPTLHPSLLHYYLDRLARRLDLVYFPSIDSTNSEAERLMSHGRKSPFAVLSSRQTKGRGRLGRQWFSESGDNLYLSVLFEPNIPPQRFQHFTLWAGVFICRALQRFLPDAPLKIKWPNDLQCHQRKFAGMLTEARMDTDRLHSIVFGIGLNLNSNPNQYPPTLRQSATSLRAIGGESLPINAVAAAVLNATCAAFERALDTTPGPSLAEAWPPLSALDGQLVTAHSGNRTVQGRAEGIDESGALLLRAMDGTLHKIAAGDVTLKQ